MGARTTLLFGTIWGLVLTSGVVSLYVIDHEPARIPLALLTSSIVGSCVLLLCGVRRVLLIVPLAISFALVALSIWSIPSLFKDPYADPIFLLAILIPGLLFVYGLIKMGAEFVGPSLPGPKPAQQEPAERRPPTESEKSCPLCKGAVLVETERCWCGYVWPASQCKRKKNDAPARQGFLIIVTMLIVILVLVGLLFIVMHKL